MRSSSPGSLLRRLGLILSVGMVAVLALGATGASAATVTKDGTVITVTGTDADEQIRVRYDGNGEDNFEVDDNTGANVAFGTGCEVDDEDASQAQCPAAGVTRFVITLAAGEDGTDFAANVDGVPATIDGGPDLSCEGFQLTGTDQGDLITGGDDTDCINGRDGNDTIDGLAGDDDLDGNNDDDTVRGGAGEDFLEGNDGTDTLEAGDGDDGMRGQNGNDTLDGGAGSDFLQGGFGDDTERGGDGDDQVNGAEGADSLYGEGGNDILVGGFEDDTLVADLIDGGDGIDLAEYSDRDEDEPVGVTLDATANDGQPNEGDNVVNIEDVATGAGADNLQALAADGPNTFASGPGNDTVDPGLFEDAVFAQEGDDTVNANDGYADVVSCGDGADTANVDPTDFVQADCEVVNRTERLSARDIPEDLPPGVTFTGPAANTTVPGRATLTADAIDDRGVARVLFLDEDQVVCSDDSAPYTCDYQAGGEDVGRKTLSAVAVDTIGQTGTSNRTIFVPRFVPTLSVGASPRSDRTFPFTFTVSGRLTPPAGVSNAAACRGTVAVQIKSRGTTISTRTVRVRPNCRYSSRITFRVRRRITTNRLTVRARYGGTDVLTSKVSRRITVGVRRG